MNLWVPLGSWGVNAWQVARSLRFRRKHATVMRVETAKEPWQCTLRENMHLNVFSDGAQGTPGLCS